MSDVQVQQVAISVSTVNYCLLYLQFKNPGSP